VNALWVAGCTFLERVHDAERGLFPYTTRVVGGAYASELDHPAAARYTVNCLLALRRADELEPGRHAFPKRWRELTTDFLRRSPEGLDNPGDRGLFLVLAAGETGSPALADAQERAYATLRCLVLGGGVAKLNLQEVCWIAWGMVALAQAGHDGAPELVDRLTGLLLSELVDPASALPRHSLSRLRRSTVSFGGIVYFLRALHEIASWSGEARVEAAFRRTLERTLASQAADGAWPWFHDTRSGEVVDRYAVYSVHQDSMAMLFLLPALDRGLDVRDAIERSYAWVLGANELGTSMIVQEPFLRYRSIERRAGLQRARRYGRALAARAGVRWSSAQTPDRLRLNTECRSYELGWVVYVWSGRSERLALAPGGRAVEFAEGA
jgi:hypothetical protein